VLEQLLTAWMPPSFLSLALSLFRNMLEKGPEWCASYSRWLTARKHALFSSMGWARFDDGAGGDNEVQRTMLELINQLYGDYLSCLWHYTDLICLIPCY
jgi:hypothetical protein